MSRAKITRRTLLRGVGATIALPWMESMAVATAPTANGPAGPRRMAFFYVPNGVHMKDWKPGAEGRDFQIPWILEPLAPLKEDMLVLTGLAQDNARLQLAGYRAGRVPIATVLEARRDWLDQRVRAIDLASKAAIVAAGLQFYFGGEQP